MRVENELCVLVSGQILYKSRRWAASWISRGMRLLVMVEECL